jgi:hypothetical protein
MEVFTGPSVETLRCRYLQSFQKLRELVFSATDVTVFASMSSQWIFVSSAAFFDREPHGTGKRKMWMSWASEGPSEALSS